MNVTNKKEQISTGQHPTPEAKWTQLFCCCVTCFLCAQDFVIYLLVAPNIVTGGQSDHEDASKPEILLFAADILPRHCCFRRSGVGSPTTLRPYQDATVTRNGELLRTEAQLTPGDVIGLGQHYLFLFKDPLAVTQKVRWLIKPDLSVVYTYFYRYMLFLLRQTCFLNEHKPTVCLKILVSAEGR